MVSIVVNVCGEEKTTIFKKRGSLEAIQSRYSVKQGGNIHVDGRVTGRNKKKIKATCTFDATINSVVSGFNVATVLAK